MYSRTFFINIKELYTHTVTYCVLQLDCLSVNGAELMCKRVIKRASCNMLKECLRISNLNLEEYCSTSVNFRFRICA